MSTISNLVQQIVPYSVDQIHNNILQYYGLLILNGAECEIIYDFEQHIYKLHNITTDEIAVVLYNTRPNHDTGNIYRNDFNRDLNILFNTEMIIRHIRREPIQNIELLRILNYGGDIAVRWIKRGRIFDINYDYTLFRDILLLSNDNIFITPSQELYHIIPAACKEDKVIYDKNNNVILNKALTHVAIVLSSGWNAPRWSIDSNNYIDKSKLFDVAKVLQILPNNKLNNKQRRMYLDNSPITYLCLKWIPVKSRFIIYYTSSEGEHCKLESDFRFRA
jgi:hypothetical protein